MEYFRSLPLTLKYLLIPGVAAFGMTLCVLLALNLADDTKSRLGHIKNRLTPSIEVAHANVIRLESFAKTLETAVSTGDTDLIENTKKSTTDFITDLKRVALEGNGQPAHIANVCRTYFEEASSFSKKIASLTAPPENFDAFKDERLRMQKAEVDCRVATIRFKESLTEALEGEINNTNERAHRNIIIVVALGVITVGGIIAIGSLITTHIRTMILQLMESLEQMRLGEGLTSGLLRCDSKDELGEMASKFNRFVGDLRGLLKSVETKNREIEHLNADLVELATTDKLTGLKNFAYFQEQLTSKTQPQRNSSDTPVLAILISDVDHFKKFNDTHGHQAGNIALQDIAARIKKMVRQMDIPCRYGGEEFVVILPSCRLKDAAALGERFRLAVEAVPVTIEDGREIFVTTSIGVAEYQPGETADQLVNRADEALYRAKHFGRNRVESA